MISPGGSATAAFTPSLAVLATLNWMCGRRFSNVSINRTALALSSMYRTVWDILTAFAMAWTEGEPVMNLLSRSLRGRRAGPRRVLAMARRNRVAHRGERGRAAL